MPRTYVSLDLETTGLEPHSDTIIEVGAVRFTLDGEVAHYSSLVNPGCPIPAVVKQLTGITDDDVRDAPPVDEVIAKLTEFVGRDPIVGHNVSFDMAFLARQGTMRRNRSIDTFELSTILMPHMTRHGLQSLATELELDAGQAHRALADARATAQLFLKLWEAAMALPASLLEDLSALGAKASWPQGHFFQDALLAQIRQPRGGSIAQLLAAKGSTMAPRGSQPALTSRGEPRRPPLELDCEQLASVLESGGSLSEALPTFEHRAEQVDMLYSVCQALNAGEHLLIEAPTGVGKSLAYLLPAIAWSSANNEPVVVSTHTINLQEQLLEKDVPLVAAILGVHPNVAVLKGRSNYVCLARVRRLAARTSLTRDQALALAKLLVWLPSTATGDRTELFLNTPGERAVWTSVASDVKWCSGEACPHRREGNCFYEAARRAAQAADVVIVNHSLLSLDVLEGVQALPAYEHLIIDEAHHFRDACTNAMRLDLSVDRTADLVTELGATVDGVVPPNSIVGRGLAAGWVRLPDGDTGLKRLGEAFGAAAAAMPGLRAAMAAATEELLPKGAYQVRLTERERERAEWGRLTEEWEAFWGPASRVGTMLEDAMREAAASSANLDEAVLSARSTVQALRQQVAALGEIIVKPDPSIVYWLTSREFGQQTEVELHRAPVDVSEQLTESLFDTKRSVILTSATLTTTGSFDYLEAQLGVPRAQLSTVGSPFDYRRAALVCIARDMPEPHNPGYQKAVETHLLALARATGGRLMALFTSYSQLRETTRAVEGPLDKDGILVFSQADGGSRNQLLEHFRTTDRSVLLGTRSFWEGVDIPGDALQCLVMVKLPFLVPDDPIVAARGETYMDSFREYHLPEAILTFRQGFGRLIRSRTDRGVFVVLDSRVRTKSYGRAFLQSLPDCTIFDGNIQSLSEQAVMWLQDRGGHYNVALRDEEVF